MTKFVSQENLVLILQEDIIHVVWAFLGRGAADSDLFSAEDQCLLFAES